MQGGQPQKGGKLKGKPGQIMEVVTNGVSSTGEKVVSQIQFVPEQAPIKTNLEQH